MGLRSFMNMLVYLGKKRSSVYEKKGKNKKLAIIAVANKLLKQVFGAVKNEYLFDRNYYKKIS